MNRRTLLALLTTLPTQTKAQPTTPLRLPLHVIDGYPTIPATLAGQPVTFIVDTGAQGMLVTPATAERLRLPPAGTQRIFGTGGSQPARIVALPGLQLAGTAMPPLLAPVLPLPIALATNPPFAGLLGALLLSRFDIQFDIQASTLTLWPPGTAPNPPGTKLPLQLSPYGEAYTPVQINGQTLTALIDTGSRSTIIGTQAAQRLGLPAYISLNKAPGIDGNPISIAQAQTVQLALGNQPPHPTPITTAPLQLTHADMLLGLDQLTPHPLAITYSTKTATLTT